MAKTTTQANTTTAVAAPYEPKPQERRMLEAARERRRARPPSPRFKLEQTGRAKALALDHSDPAINSALLMEALSQSHSICLRLRACRVCRYACAEEETPGPGGGGYSNKSSILTL